MAEMIRAMSGHVRVNLAVQDAADEADARGFLLSRGVPLGHVHFFRLEHGDLWARDMGPQFTRSSSGKLRVNDWNFSMWGHEEPDSDNSTFEESFDRRVASTIHVPAPSAQAGPETGVRLIHEGGGVTHNGRGTMIAVESVVIQRNLGPGRFCGGEAPVTDYDQPNTYAPHPDWPACRTLVEAEYRRMLGAQKVIWVPTGIAEDNATLRGALARHIHVPELGGVEIPHAGVYTLFTTNGHADEFVRFVSPDTLVLAREDAPHGTPDGPEEELRQWLQAQNHERLERVYDIVRHATNESGRPLRVVRIPMPALTLEVFGPGDAQYDYFSGYDRWEDGVPLPEVMLGVWPASYVNYAPTNDLVMVPAFWKPGRPLESKLKDQQARETLRSLFPGRKIVQIHPENVVRGGGGMNCITQQQPASGKFARTCGWAKVQVGAGTTRLYAGPSGGSVLGTVPRLSGGADVYLQRLTSSSGRVKVRVVGGCDTNGEIGWVEEDDIESAGEKCPAVYSPN
jgi:agmatine deiminase